MAATVEVRPLQPGDDRGGFSCGDPQLDRFFQHYAGQNQFRLHVAVTYVAMAGTHIAGFATVAAASVERADLPEDTRRRRMPAYPLPVLRLARLGVATRLQGKGVGRALLRHVFRVALEQRDTVGCVGIVADAKPDAIGFHESLGFVSLPGVREGMIHGEPQPMFLAIATVASTL